MELITLFRVITPAVLNAEFNDVIEERGNIKTKHAFENIKIKQKHMKIFKCTF